MYIYISVVGHYVPVSGYCRIFMYIFRYPPLLWSIGDPLPSRCKYPCSLRTYVPL